MEVVSREVMRVADVNRNGDLSFTELTSMLGGSPYEVKRNPNPDLNKTKCQMVSV